MRGVLCADGSLTTGLLGERVELASVHRAGNHRQGHDEPAQ